MPKTPAGARPARYLRLPPFTDVLPTPVFFRMEHMPSHATYPQMCHPWGEFVYAFSGTTEVKAGDEHYITPPHLGLWIAPGTEHVGFNEQETVHCSVYISRDLCTRMPATSCAVMVSPLVRAILEHLRVTPAEEEGEAQRARLLRVLVDQLSTCATTGSFVPHTDDADLNAILQVLRQNPADNRSLAELADAFHMSERTLMRRAQNALGMSLTEWRQRIRLVNALPMLHAGRSVEAVALDLGYATSSAFIAMFRRLTGTSPGQFVARTRPA